MAWLRTTMAGMLIGVVLLFAAACPNGATTRSNSTGSSTTSAGGSTTAAGGWTGDAKDFSFTSFSGAMANASDFAGKPLVINFWSMG